VTKAQILVARKERLRKSFWSVIVRRATQAAANGLGGSLLPGLVSVKGCTDFADVCAVNADSLVKLFAGDAERLRPVSDIRGNVGVDLVRVEGSSLFRMFEGHGACNDF
jgi:hypothetical protein